VRLSKTSNTSSLSYTEAIAGEKMDMKVKWGTICEEPAPGGSGDKENKGECMIELHCIYVWKTLF
jgi:hypothetical protein